MKFLLMISAMTLSFSALAQNDQQPQTVRIHQYDIEAPTAPTPVIQNTAHQAIEMQRQQQFQPSKLRGPSKPIWSPSEAEVSIYNIKPEDAEEFLKEQRELGKGVVVVDKDYQRDLIPDAINAGIELNPIKSSGKRARIFPLRMFNGDERFFVEAGHDHYGDPFGLISYANRESAGLGYNLDDEGTGYVKAQFVLWRQKEFNLSDPSNLTFMTFGFSIRR